MQVLVVGAGVVGLACARAAAHGRPRGDRRGSRERYRHRHVLAQQRGHPRRPLLSDRLEARPALRARAADALRFLRLPRRAAPQMRQARRRHQRRARSRGSKRSSSRRRSTACEGVEMIDGAAARRLEPALSCVAPCARRKPASSTATATCWRCEGDLEDHGGVVALNTPIERLVQIGGRLGGSFRRRRSAVDHRRRGGQRGRARRAKARRATEGYPQERVPRLFFGEGQLFQLCRPAGVFAADLSGADPGRARRARDARSRRPHALRARRRVDRTQENYDVDPARAAAFYAPHPRLLAGAAGQLLVPDYSGIRPKLTGPSEAAADFMIDAPQGPWRARARAAVRHRIAGAHLGALAR